MTTYTGRTIYISHPRYFVLAAMTAIACLAAAAWITRGQWMGPKDSTHARSVESLVRRCGVQMLADTCRVMNTPALPQSSSRLFIAGIGEVDAAATAAIRSYGNNMCEEVGVQCASNWDGASCRIARALYATVPK
jgi:hypothetical protein